LEKKKLISDQLLSQFLMKHLTVSIAQST